MKLWAAAGLPGPHMPLEISLGGQVRVPIDRRSGAVSLEAWPHVGAVRLWRQVSAGWSVSREDAVPLPELLVFLVRCLALDSDAFPADPYFVLCL